MKVQGIECLLCGDKIWSRHRHDFRWCKCEKVAVDGGREYLKIVGEAYNFRIIDLEV
jgi:hypothetical protein